MGSRCRATRGSILALGGSIKVADFCPWRTTAAQAALALGDRRRAREDRELAKRTGVLHARTRALRVLGLCEPGDGGLKALRAAVELGATAPPRLETVRALVDLGAALRRAPGVLATTSSPAGVAGLSARQLAGQRVIYSYAGLTPPPSLLAKIRAGEAAGGIVFGENISSRAQIRMVIGELQQAAAQSLVKAPLLMLIDQEAAASVGSPGGPELSEKQIGASAHPLYAARQAAHDAGLKLNDVGINVNLAPVLDVYRKPGDFIDQFGRSLCACPPWRDHAGRQRLDRVESLCGLGGVGPAAEWNPVGT